MACHYKPYHLHHEDKILNYDQDEQDLTKSALIIVNVQKAFLPGGSLSILNNRNDARRLSMMMINNINELIESNIFDYHVYVQDAHPHDHVSFASKSGAKPFQVSNNGGMQEILWPDHCRIDGRDKAENGSGVEFADGLIVPESFKNPQASDTSGADSLAKKSFVLNIGENKNISPYSAFKDYTGKETGLADSLLKKGVKNLYVVGIARDFAAWWTAADATTYREKNTTYPIFNTHFIWDATLPVPGARELLEYEYDGEINSYHHNFLRYAIENKNYDIDDVMRGLVNHDSMGNRWAQTYLSPYGIRVFKTADVLKALNKGSTINTGTTTNTGTTMNAGSTKKTGSTVNTNQKGGALDFLYKLYDHDLSSSTFPSSESEVY